MSDGSVAARQPRASSPTRFNDSIVDLQGADVMRIVGRYVPSLQHGPEPSAEALARYRRAMVHRSYVVDVDDVRDRLNEGCPRGCLPLQKGSYDRLEFLGDAVLGLVSAAYLFARYPSQDEGFMTRMRSHLVNGKMLARLCGHTGLKRHVAMTPAGAPVRADVLEDVLEAFVGALFLDLGFETAREWVVSLYETHVDFGELAARQDTPLSILNRHFMSTAGFVPRIESLTETRSRIVTPQGVVIGTGTGRTSSDAAEDAVRKAIKQLGLRKHAPGGNA